MDIEEVEYRVTAHGIRLDGGDFTTIWCSLADAKRKYGLLAARGKVTIQKRVCEISIIESFDKEE